MSIVATVKTLILKTSLCLITLIKNRVKIWHSLLAKGVISLKHRSRINRFLQTFLKILSGFKHALNASSPTRLRSYLAFTYGNVNSL